jgi:hypothetical protein
VEECLYATTDIVLPNIALAECVRPHRRMVHAVLGEEASDQIGVPAVPSSSEFFCPLARHFCAHSSLLSEYETSRNIAVIESEERAEIRVS